MLSGSEIDAIQSLSGVCKTVCTVPPDSQIVKYSTDPAVIRFEYCDAHSHFQSFCSKQKEFSTKSQMY